jgi:hypothetical protein
MRTYKPFLFTLLLIGLVLGACDQDAIFYHISQEVEPLEPRIEGAPTNLAVFERTYPDPANPVTALFVASGKLHWYIPPSDVNDQKNPQKWWDRKDLDIPGPGGNMIMSLAATDRYLYVLTASDASHIGSFALKRISKGGTNWERILPDSADTIAQNHPYLGYIFTDSGKLFVSARTAGTTQKGNDYAILYMNEDTLPASNGSVPGLKGLASGVGVPRGAANSGPSHFLATGSGIFMTRTSVSQDLDPATLVPNSDKDFMGIISFEYNSKHTVLGIERSGDLYSVTETGIQSIINDIGIASGGLALWRNPGDPAGSPPRALLVGIQGSLSMTTSVYNNGYREVDIDSTGSITSSSAVHEPGIGSFTSASNNERYRSTIGKYPVNFIFQAPPAIDPEMTLFAATQNEGLWSYRKRSGEDQWNAEE